MKILFVGDLNKYGRSFQRFRTFGEMGHAVAGITSVPVPYRPGIEKSGIFERILWKLGLPPDKTSANKQIEAAVKREKFDAVWIEKGVTIRPKTLRFVKRNAPETKLVFCSEDDMYARHNRTVYFNKGVKYYDIVFTTKIYNLEELKNLGAKKTALFLDAYDEKVHRPMRLSDYEKTEFGADISFIGMFEADRAERILYLAENGLPVTVWGSGWSGWVGKNKNMIVKNKMLLEDDYARAINATKINLCFLRKINRDQVTSRSVEIPACGGFLLGERTARHLEFFEEGKEMEFFDSNEEMLKKARYYLENPKEREKIAFAGRERCIRSGYSMRSQLGEMLLKIR
jgi:spore maturation protein CgeB